MAHRQADRGRVEGHGCRSEAEVHELRHQPQAPGSARLRGRSPGLGVDLGRAVLARNRPLTDNAPGVRSSPN
eukprot:15139909-Alexandrium_andersonii.AAC.1